MGNSVLFTTIIILFLIFLLVFLKVLYMSTCKNTLTESFDTLGVARGTKNCSDRKWISNCEQASDCDNYWSEVPANGPPEHESKPMQDKGEPMACNYDGGGRDGEGKCTFKVNQNGTKDKVNDKWMCERGTAHKEDHSATTTTPTTTTAAATTTTPTTTTAAAATTTCPECVCDTSSLDNEINDLNLEITNLRQQISFMQNTER